MTYKQLTKEIENVGEQIRFLYDVRDKYFKKDKHRASMIGNAVNSLCAYQNYLRFGKEYESESLGFSESRGIAAVIGKNKINF